MSKVRIVLMTGLAAMCLNAIAAASASAVECKKEANGKFVLCIGEPLVLTVGTFTLHILANTAGEYTIATANVTIKCKKVLLTTAPKIIGAATSVTIKELILHFTECSVTRPAGCAISNGLIITLSLEGVVKNKDEVLIFPEAAGNIHIATISFINKGLEECLIAGNDNLVTEKNNHEEGPLLKAPALEATGFLEELIFQPASTHLQLNKEAAKMEGTLSAEVLDEKGEALKWAVVEGK